MPNRIIKETICTNEQLDRLSPFEETFFYRLIVNADDYGRMDGRPSILRARLFPLKTLRDDQIEKALASLTSVELVHRYTVHGKPFVRLLGWERNQQIRAKKSRYPAPEDADECEPIPAPEAICNQLISDDIRCSRNPIQYKSESKSNPNPDPEAERARARESAAATATLGIEAYAAANLDHLSPRNMEDLAGFMEHLPDELVRHAIDEACANGKRTWAYVRSILLRYSRAGYKTIGEVLAAESERESQKQAYSGSRPNPALNYAQRTHSDSDYSALFVDLDSYGGDDHAQH